MDNLLAAFGWGAVLVALLYAAALQALTGALKRATRGTRAEDIRPELWALGLGAVTGPAVWPWLWQIAELGGPEPQAGHGVILGIGTAAVATALYPLITQRITRRLRGE
jgi:hypothetical protein